MSRKAKNLARAVLIGAAVALEVVVVFYLITSPPANLAAMFGSLGGLVIFALHVLASALLAAGFGGFIPGGTTSDRASVVVLYLIVAFTLPGVGMVGVVLLGLLLGRGGKEVEDSARFALGNPLTEGGQENVAKPHLEPLAASIRCFDTPETRAAVLALRHRADRSEVAAVIKRFRHDSDSELQFFAGSAIDGVVERAEASANALTQRVAADPNDADAHTGLASGLIKAARTAAPGDRRRLAAAACEHLAAARKVQPSSQRLSRLAGRALMLTGDNAAADEVLANESATSPERLELLYRKRDWAALKEIAGRAAEDRPELGEVLAFCGGREGGSA